MMQGLLVLAVVTAAALWLGWRALPRRLRQKVTGKKGGGGCGCGCGD
ncbi:hypothetical protein [Telmatospirillum sp.]|nr:hypothetical protein [Telmatospirillum sp.]MDR3440938.1 hypothetical protein [Telmatospirillum sp.]